MPGDSVDVPEVAAVWVPLEKLLPWAQNPRKNDKASVKRVADSIQRFGFAAPVVARKADGEIIAGHTRVLAAKALGLPSVPVRYLDLDPAEAHLLAIADNRLNALTEWDDAALADILGPLMMAGEDAAAVAGFDDKAIAELLKRNADDVLAAGPSGPTDAWGEWQGMPDYASEDQRPHRSLVVHFADAEAVARFQAALGLSLGPAVKFTWYPYRAPDDNHALAYVDERA